ncbi:MAG: hypothetical protein M1812_002415 [Candelaria pacifica]|nr:MAG: hypothetical protein M1812_002415 [Candelaria pacifica]
MAVVTTAPPTLSFPRQTFAKLSPHPFLLAHLTPAEPIRPNGRSPKSFRSPTLNTSSLSHASGSAVVRIGDTAVVCGVRGEILLASDVPGHRVGSSTQASNNDEIAELDLLAPNIELSTGCSPAHLPGQPPSPLAQTLAQRILSLLHSSTLVKAEDLRIWHTPSLIADSDTAEGSLQEPEVKAFWCLYIDILFISLDGNPFDAAWAAVIAALRDTKLPYAWWDIDREMILCSDKLSQAKRLQLADMPMAATFAVITSGRNTGEQKSQAWILADPDTFEEELCREVISVVVQCSVGRNVRLKKIEKSGGGIIGKEEMSAIVAMAGERWEEWHSLITGTV